MIKRNSKGQFVKGSKAHLGIKHTEEIKQKIGKNTKKGLAKPEVKKKLKELKGNGNLVGHKPSYGRLGKHHTNEAKEKISRAKKGKNIGENHHNWKGGYKRKLWHNGQRRIMKLKAEGFHTFEEWEKLKKKCDYICQECGLREPFENQSCKILTEDHIIPLSKGGTDYIKNIQPLCRRCNCIKKDKILFIN